MNNMTIREAIELQMKVIGLKSRALCNDLGLTETNFSAYINGKRGMPMSDVERVCEYLGLEITRHE